MDEQNLEETMAILSRTPATLDALLRGQPAIWTMRNEGGDSWSAFNVIGHLIDGERVNWIPRAQMILEYGESEVFVPFDRLAHMKSNQDQSIEQLLDTFSKLREENLTTLAGWNLQPEDLDRRGMHPTFGPITLSNLLSTWAMHDLTHLHQLTRILAYQYRETVGPYSKFLGVMHCNGHSSN
jgi:hypothetical protein